jgi:hypothetical protein
VGQCWECPLSAYRSPRGERWIFVELEVSEQLALLCDVRLEGGPEGFEAELEDMSRADIELLFGEAVDALLDAQTKHEREMRRLIQRLQR